MMSSEEAEEEGTRKRSAIETEPIVDNTDTIDVTVVPSATVPAASPPSVASDAGARPSKIPRKDKAYKGLRHFSMMVCKKVEEKGKTTYNEVADELVHAVVMERKQQNPAANYDEKNIRRRVYDALNVLMAMDIIAKEKKEITWKGLPSGATQDLDMLQKELDFRRHEVQKKRDALVELIVQQVCFRNLVQHNQQREMELAARGASGKPDNKIPLPFIVVNTHSSAVIQCNMSRDLTDVMFDFSMPFEINDDNTILKKLGMNRTTMSQLQEWLPEDIMRYCEDNGMLNEILEGKSEGPGVLVATSDYESAFASSPVSTRR